MSEAAKRKQKAGAAKEAKNLCLAGLELGGGKSGRTAIVALKYFPAQRKLFIERHLPHLAATKLRTGDEVLLEALAELEPQRLAVGAPLSLPPCAPCRLQACHGVRECREPEVRWMRAEAERFGISPLKFPTPYTQRALDIYLKCRVQPRYNQDLFLEETLGAGRAPIAMRLQFLRSRLGVKRVEETLPRLSLFAIAPWFQITDRELRRYRNPEDGVGYRYSILEKMESAVVRAKVPELFLYESDLAAIAADLASFYALVSAYTAACSEARLLETPDVDYDPSWGFLALPRELA